MQRKTTQVTLPESKILIDLNDWVNGREAEYADEPIYSAVQMGGSIGGNQDMNVKSIDARVAVQESAHREIEIYVSCIHGETEIKEPKEVLKFILNEVPESDYKFVQTEIAKIKETSKKK